MRPSSLSFTSVLLVALASCASETAQERNAGDEPLVATRKAQPAETLGPEEKRDAGVPSPDASTSKGPKRAAVSDAAPSSAEAAVATKRVYGEADHASAKHRRRKKRRPGLPLPPSDLVVAFSGADHVVAVASPVSASKRKKRKDWLVERKVTLRIVEVLEGEESDAAIDASEIVATREDFMTLRDTQVVILAPCREKGGRERLVVKTFFYPTWPELRLIGDLGKKQAPRAPNKPVPCNRASPSAAGLTLELSLE